MCTNGQFDIMGSSRKKAEVQKCTGQELPVSPVFSVIGNGTEGDSEGAIVAIEVYIISPVD